MDRNKRFFLLFVEYNEDNLRKFYPFSDYDEQADIEYEESADSILCRDTDIEIFIKSIQPTQYYGLDAFKFIMDSNENYSYFLSSLSFIELCLINDKEETFEYYKELENQTLMSIQALKISKEYCNQLKNKMVGV